MTENPNWLTNMADEIIDSLASMTADEARAAEQRHGYGLRDNDYRSFWD